MRLVSMTPAEDVRRDLLERSIRDHARIVDPYVDPAELLDGAPGELVDLSLAPHVGGHRDRLRPEGLAGGRGIAQSGAWRPASTRWLPHRAKRIAAQRPMPPAGPVMTTTAPVRSRRMARLNYPARSSTPVLLDPAPGGSLPSTPREWRRFAPWRCWTRTPPWRAASAKSSRPVLRPTPRIGRCRGHACSSRCGCGRRLRPSCAMPPPRPPGRRARCPRARLGRGQCPGRNLVLLTTSLLLARILRAGQITQAHARPLRSGAPLPATLSPFRLRFRIGRVNARTRGKRHRS